MVLDIQLLGTPRVKADGTAAKVRGHKAWGLLAYLLLAETPPSRQHLAGLLLPDADDPVGALRWNLSQLRRLLGGDATVEGDPVRLDLPAGTVLDVRVLTRGRWTEAVQLPGLGRELLEGMSFGSAPGFDLWLATERRRLSGAAAGALHEAALVRLGRGETAAALDHATALVGLDPFDENARVLLVRCLRASGDHAGAEREVTATIELFRQELGVTPGPALREAAAAPAHGDARTVGRAAIIAQLEAGEAATKAGAIEAGIAALRRAAVGARAADEADVLVQTLVALGGALVHSARGSDEDGAAALHEAATLAEHAGDREAAALAYRELGYIDFLRGRYDNARGLLRQAGELAAGDDGQTAWVEIVTGAVDTDVARYADAEKVLTRGIDRAAGADDHRGVLYGLSFLGRVQLLRGELDTARQTLTTSVEGARTDGWLGFLPWPEALLADVHLHAGDPAAAEAAFSHALALGQQLGDPCWESIGTRGLGLVAATQGRTDDAITLLDDAPRLCRRLPDAYLWIEAYALEALCDLAVVHAPDSAGSWIELLERIAARAGMRELLVRATVHRDRLGQPGAREAAQALLRDLDNPMLEALLDG